MEIAVYPTFTFAHGSAWSKQATLSALFRRFIETYITSGQVITIGSYSIWGRPILRAAIVTLRADVDVVTDESGQAHVVTVFMGRGDTKA